MSKSNDRYIVIRMSEKLMTHFEGFCVSKGMTVSEAVSLLISETIKYKGVPFEIAPMYGKKYEDTSVSADAQQNRVSVRVDPEARKEFADVCKSIGIPQGRIVKMFMLNCLNKGKLPF